MYEEKEFDKVKIKLKNLKMFSEIVFAEDKKRVSHTY